MQPLVLSPKAWMCMPRSALASLPVMFHVMVVSADSEACSKVTVPLTLESPRRTATDHGISRMLRSFCKRNYVMEARNRYAYALPVADSHNMVFNCLDLDGHNVGNVE